MVGSPVLVLVEIKQGLARDHVPLQKRLRHSSPGRYQDLFCVRSLSERVNSHRAHLPIRLQTVCDTSFQYQSAVVNTYGRLPRPPQAPGGSLQTALSKVTRRSGSLDAWSASRRVTPDKVLEFQDRHYSTGLPGGPRVSGDAAQHRSWDADAAAGAKRGTAAINVGLSGNL